jgi:xanthine dehydrogenase small subunit
LYFYINDKEYKISSDIHQTLADFLRKRVFLTGTKIVCAEGDCGACSVLIYKPSEDFIQPAYYPINSCIMSLGQVDGCHLITVDHLSSSNDLSEVQKNMLKANASQCGFCTPGFVVALTGLCQKISCQEDLNYKSVQNSLTGNLCRCTGYESIIKAGCETQLSKVPQFSQIEKYKKIHKKIKLETKQSVFIQDGQDNFYSPNKLPEVKYFFRKFKSFKILGAGTDLGVQKNKNKITYQNLLSLQHIKDLKQIKRRDSKVFIGARVTIEQLRKYLKKYSQDCVNYINIFASPQIKNVATVVGNVVNASPIADLTPMLIALNAELKIYNAAGLKRSVKLENFYLDYKKTNLKNQELVFGIEFDLPKSTDYIKLYKTSQRRDLDISAVNCVFRLKTKARSEVSLTASVGGCSFKTLKLTELEKQFSQIADFYDPKKISVSRSIIQSSINPISDLRGSSQFRRFLVSQYFDCFIHEVQNKYKLDTL